MSSVTGPGGESARDRLVAAARELLTEGQPESITVRAIATKAGVQHSLISRHFGSSDALFAVVVADVLLGVGADAEAAPDLKGALDTIIEEFALNPGLTRSIGALVTQGIVPSEPHHPIVRALETHLGSQPIPAGERRATAIALIMAIFGWMLAETWWLQILDRPDDPVAGRSVLYRTIDAILADAQGRSTP